MATTPVKQPPPVPPVEGFEQRFRRLETQWKSDTLVLSDPGKIMVIPRCGRSLRWVGNW